MKLLKDKRVLITVLSIILVLVVMSSTTYALFFKVHTMENLESYTSGVLEITVEEGTALTLNNTLPMEDSEGASLTPYTFKVTNTGNLAYTFDLKLLSTTSNNQINPAYIKIKLDDNSPVTLSSLSEGLIANDLKLNPEESITMSVRIWLSIDTPNSEIGKNFSAKIVTDGVGSEYVPPLDTSGANTPDLLEGLIPIMYKENKWVKADETNKNIDYQWYDYGSQIWANAVLVNDESRSAYESGNVGIEINESDVLAYYVWVPRYKYKLFNAEKRNGIDSYNARTTGIDIIFEKEIESTGTVKCSLSPLGDEYCTNALNGEYYTHPAFTFGGKQLKGIWIGKFEITGDLTTPTIKPNMGSLRSLDVSTIDTTIAKISKNSNVYGINSSESDSHMMKNIEWGAVVYLSNSKYGRCLSESCIQISGNNYYRYVTGCGSNFQFCDAYTTESGMLSSTTGNIYGIYDMSGGAAEYVMGNVISNRGPISGFSETKNSGYIGILSETDTYLDNGKLYPDQKYYDTYLFDQTPFPGTKGHLGDATSEIITSQGDAWNSNYVSFVYSINPWFVRSGMFSDNKKGIFYFASYYGSAELNISSRAVLVRD